VIVAPSNEMVFALTSRDQAVERSDIALARQLAVQSKVLRVANPHLLDRSALLAVEAHAAPRAWRSTVRCARLSGCCPIYRSNTPPTSRSNPLP